MSNADNLQRDPISGAILYDNRDAVAALKRRRQAAQEQSEQIAALNRRIEHLESLVNEILVKVNGNSENKG